MDILIEKLSESDFENLFDFELENRDYFEEMVPGRGEDYYHLETFTKEMKNCSKNNLGSYPAFI